MRKYSALLSLSLFFVAGSASAEGCCIVTTSQPGAFVCTTASAAACQGRGDFLAHLPGMVCVNPGESLANCAGGSGALARQAQLPQERQGRRVRPGIVAASRREMHVLGGASSLNARDAGDGGASWSASKTWLRLR